MRNCITTSTIDYGAFLNITNVNHISLIFFFLIFHLVTIQDLFLQYKCLSVQQEILLVVVVKPKLMNI